MRIAVIGAGPAGLTAAYKISGEIGKRVSCLDVYERSGAVGGMSRSITLWDQRVDLGPHRFFSKDRKINELWLEIVGSSYRIVERKTRIYYKNRFFHYPIRVFDALRGLGITESIRCIASYVAVKIRPHPDTSTFEGWVTNRFGRRLYSIFFKTYSEKLWGIKCTDLDSDFAAQRIKKLSLSEAIKNALSARGRNKHATLADQFAYPLEGTGSVYESMAKIISGRGGEVKLHTPVKKVVTVNGYATGLEFEDGSTIEYDHVISTMPLSLLVQSMKAVPDDILERTHKLKFRNTILAYLRVDRTDLFPDQWIYIHDAGLKTGRITNFRNWIPEIYGDDNYTVICMEYWCNFGDALWHMNDIEIGKLAAKEFAQIGFSDEKDIHATQIIRLPRCYPVYFKDYLKNLKPVQNFLDGIKNLHVIGRYGAYKYNNQDHSLLMGMLAAENIIGGKQHELWEINTDYEVYQESSVITKTGLQTPVGK